MDLTVIMLAAAAILFAGGVLTGRRISGRQTLPLRDDPQKPIDLTSLAIGDAPQQRLLRTILDTLPVSITIVGPGGRYIFANSYEADRWGFDRDAVFGKSAYDTLPTEIAENARREDAQIFETGAPLPFFEEKSIINGEEKAALIGKIPVRDDDGSVAGVCMVGMDVTDRMLAREELERGNTDYLRTLNFYPEAVYVIIDGQIVFANRTARELFRSTSDADIIGTPSINLIHPGDHHVVEHDRRTLRAGENTSEKRPYRYRRLDGTEFRGLGSATAITWDGRHAILVVVHDITTQLERNAEIEAARHAADTANRAKSEFLASMSHEIRTPLNGILGMANMLRDGNLEAAQRKQVGIILDSGGLLLTLLNDILDLSKIEAGGLELETIDFDVTAVLEGLLDIWSAKAAEKGLAYIHHVETLAAPVLMSDPTRIRQILFNLVSNAVKFTEAGEIRVQVTQTGLPDGRYETRFDVSDTGEGIAPDSLKLLFSKFTQADSSVTRRHGGTGLGLSISKQLAEAMGGRIGVDSTEGAGSTFWFTVVCPEGDPANIADDTAPTDTACETRALQILVAEDNGVNRIVIRAMLEKAGHDITIVENGLEAVHAVQTGDYDVVLMDIHMPEMDGISATRKIREIDGERGKVPIVALTANAMKGNREEFVGNGMDDYVSKPIDPEELTAALRRQCGEGVSSASGAITPLNPVAPRDTAAGGTALGEELSAIFDAFDPNDDGEDDGNDRT